VSSPSGGQSPHNKMVGLVERMLELNKHVAAAFRPPQERVRLKASATPELDRLERDIAATGQGEPPPCPLPNPDRNFVYELYGIPDEERKVTEGT
jgi:hypothetical protein